MLYRALADVVVVVHLAFLVFVAVGGLLAWRWPGLLWLHVPALVWGLLSITVGLSCPLTSVEKHLRHAAGEEGYAGGFVDRYVEDVVYPGELTALLRAVAAAVVAVGYAVLVVRRRRHRAPALG